MAYGANGYGNYNAYKEVGVKTASQGKLVVMLYDAACKHMEEAISMVDTSNKIKAQNIESYGNHIQKVSDIITELQMSLDMDKGGDIAKNLMSLYIYFNNQLLDCSISHNRERLNFVYKMLSDLRDSWANAAASTANTKTQMPADRPAVNITL